MSPPEIKLLKDTLGLEPHPEGGYFKRFYCSEETLASPKRFGDNQIRSTASAIFFLLESGNFSAFHRLKSDEIWLYQAGNSLTLYEIALDGTLSTHLLGNPLNHPGAQFQYTFYANRWFAAEISEPSAYTLVSCLVSPEFTYQDFELGKREALIAQFPKHQAIITRLTRE